MTSPIPPPSYSSNRDDSGCLLLIILAIIGGIAYGIYELWKTDQSLVITIASLIGIALFTAIAIWIFVSIMLPPWTIVGMIGGVYLIGGIMYFIKIPILYIGVTMTYLLSILSFIQLLYFDDVKIWVIVSLLILCLVATLLLYIFVGLLVAIIGFFILLVIFYFLAEYIDEIS